MEITKSYVLSDAAYTATPDFELQELTKKKQVTPPYQILAFLEKTTRQKIEKSVHYFRADPLPSIHLLRFPLNPAHQSE